MAKQDPETWTQADAVALRTFLSDNPKFLIALANRRPKSKGDTMEARAVSGSEAEGHLGSIEIIKTMCNDPLPQSDDAGFIAERKRK